MDNERAKDNFSNLNRSYKWLGIIDYKSLAIFLIMFFLVWNLLSIFTNNTVYKTYTLVIIAIPVIGLFYANRSSENISYVIYIVLKYIVSPKIYVYNIESNKAPEINVVKCKI